MDENVEQDRGLREQQTRVDALTARSGTLTAAIAVAAGLLASRTVQVPGDVLALLGVAVGLGVLVLLGRRLVTGADPAQLAAWSADPTANAEQEVYWSKVAAWRRNEQSVRRVQTAFTAQAVVVAATVIDALVRVRSGR